MDLAQFGWSDFFARQCAEGMPGRVACACRDQFVVWTEGGEVEAAPSGRLRFESPLWPVVGDWVILREDGRVIDRVLHRRTTVSRKQPGRDLNQQVLAANVDVLFVVVGLDRDYNPRRLERYLVIAHESGARPVIVLNKADLADKLGFRLDEVMDRTRALATGAPVLSLSATTDRCLDVLAVKRGETAALIGSSGAGKSTILNRLLSTEKQRTGAVRAGDDRGRHTTTARELFRMPGGWQMIDMPGLREVGLWAGGDAVEGGFQDIQELATQCRFRDCTHSGEPGCAVLAAGLEEARLANFHKMRRELEFMERKTDPHLERQTRAKWKAIHKAMRRNPKHDW
jgi:ribosome biogenesis GTPase / thiamine phosphate phosphatase